MEINKRTVAVITGAGSGIGRALACAFAKRGAAVALSDINAAGLNETAKLASQFGGEVSTHLLDVSDKEAMHSFADEVVSRHGHATVLINNAGVGILGNTEELSIDDYEWLIGINFWGVLYGTKLFLPHLRKESEAYIVNISSIFGIIAPSGQSAYCAAKFAVRGFTEALRHEMEADETSNVHVAVVHPGGIKTNIAAQSRLGSYANKENFQDIASRFDKAAPTSPEKAAETIINGINRNARRIMIGPDSRILAMFQRMMPVSYWNLLGPVFERRLGKV